MPPPPGAGYGTCFALCLAHPLLAEKDW